jgi:hypothetical protein
MRTAERLGNGGIKGEYTSDLVPVGIPGHEDVVTQALYGHI